MSRRKSAKTKERTVTESLQEYGRGVAGGLMFSLPLLYTREVWTGFIAHPYRLIGYVLTTFVLLLGYNRYSGLRRDSSMKEVAIDSVEEMGIGLFLGALLLFLLGRITLGMAIIEIVGIIVVGAMTVAIGVSIGTAQLGAGARKMRVWEELQPGMKFISVARWFLAFAAPFSLPRTLRRRKRSLSLRSKRHG